MKLDPPFESRPERGASGEDRRRYIVVTGGSGFLGSHVVEELVRRGHEVGIFDRQPPPPGFAVGDFRYIEGDLTDLESVTEGFAGADAVCHLGGVGDVYLAAKDPSLAAQLNVTASCHVGEAALANGVGKVVYASTWEVYGVPTYEPLDEAHPCRPDHPYNITKYGGELMLLAYDHLRGLPVLPLRLGTSFGVRMRPNSVFSIFISRAQRGETISIQGNGEQIRHFTHARDIARAFAIGVESETHGAPLNIVSAESTSIRRLAELVTARLPAPVEYLPARAGDISPAQVSSSKAASVLGWTAEVPFKEGLDELIDAAIAVHAG